MDDYHLFGAMQTFVSVVETGSFSQCARILGTSQPSVSRQISQLEEQLGIRLLQRSTRRLSLTEAGQVYYHKARSILRDVIEAGQSIRDLADKPSGLLRVSVPHTWADRKIAPYLDRFLELYPDIRLDLECNDTIQDMIEDRLDLVIRVGRLTDSSYIAVPFGSIDMVLCASPQYLQQHGTPTSIEDLSQHNFIAYENYNQLIIEHDEKKLVSVSGNISSNNVNLILSSVLQHLGISLLPDMLISSYLNTGQLIELLPDTGLTIKDLPVEQAFALYSSRKQLPAKVRAFIDFFKPMFAPHGKKSLYHSTGRR